MSDSNAQSGKVALITGGSRGIGAEVARRLARDGFVTVINYSGDAAPAEALAREIEKTGGRSLTAKADVSDPKDVRRMFESAETAFGGVDVLVNSAGIMTLGPIGRFEDAAFDRLIAVNFKGTFNTLREAANRLRSDGRIVNFSSSVVGLYQPNYAVYAATKAAVEAMTHVFIKEVRGRRITVNTVAPGPVATDLFLNANTPESIERLTHLSPLERLGTPDDIANVISFLVGPDGGWVNGQVLRANGGVI